MPPESPPKSLLDRYAEYAGPDAIMQLRQLASSMPGMKVVHVNSTRTGGGVAEILEKLVPLMQELGFDASWEVIEGNEDFFACTKSFHNSLQGKSVNIPERLLRVYEEVNARNADRLRSTLESADVVFIHDPQPAALITHCPNRKGKWIWRCHIDLSHPFRPVWKYLRNYVALHDASVFSLDAFAQPLQHPVFLIAPSIDPLSEKNLPVSEAVVSETYRSFNIDRERPVIIQVSRFDRFKDPLGVMHAYRLAKAFVPSLQLILVGGGAVDDPEGDAVIREVREAVQGDPDIHILASGPYTERTINALQTGANIVLQKSLREGFGLTVTEAMWKGKPVIGGNTGGIRLQVMNHRTGFLVDTPEGAAMRIRYLLFERDRIRQMGENGRELVRQNFLITRHLREYLTAMVALAQGGADRIELS